MSRCSPGCAPPRTWCRWWRPPPIIGRQIDRGLLCAVVDLSDDDVDDVIDELEDALVLEPWGTDGWRFRHELLREVAAELAPPSVRRGLHAKVADALVGGGAVTRTGGWSPPTTSTPSGSTRRPRPISRPRRMHGVAARWPRRAPT